MKLTCWRAASFLRIGIAFMPSAIAGAITTGQEITPAGKQSIFSEHVHAVTFGLADNVIYIALRTGDIFKLDWHAKKVLEIAQGGRRIHSLRPQPRSEQKRTSGALTGNHGT